MRRLSWLAMRVAWALLAVVVLVTVAAMATQTAPFRNWLRQLAERQVARVLNGQLSIDRLDGNLFTGAELSGVTIRQDDRDVIVVDRVSARYDPWGLLRGELELASVTLTRPVIVMIRDARGWRLADLVRRSQGGGPPRPFAINALTITGGRVFIEDRVDAPSVRQGATSAARARQPPGSAPGNSASRWPQRITDLEMATGFRSRDGRIEFDIQRAAFRTEAPAIEVRSFAGRITSGRGLVTLDEVAVSTAQSMLALSGRYQSGQPGTVMARVAATPLNFDEFAAFVPALAGRSLVPTVFVTADGPPGALEISTDMTDPRAGAIRARVVADLANDVRRVRGAVELDQVDLALLLNDPVHAGPTSVDADVDLTFRGAALDSLQGPVQLRSGRSRYAGYQWDALTARVNVMGRRLRLAATNLRAYGASGSADGTIDFRGPVSYALEGRLQDVDLRRLPRRFRIPPLEGRLAGRYNARGVRGRVQASMQFESSVLEGATIAAGSEGRLDLRNATPAWGFTGGVAALDVARLGRALGVEAISGDRFVSQLNGQVAVDGSGTSLNTLRLTAMAALESSSLFGASLTSAALDVALADETLNGTVRADLAEVDLERLTGRPALAGHIAGGVDLRGTVSRLGEPLSLDSVEAEGSITLAQSSIGTVAIDMAQVKGRVAGRDAEIASLNVIGPNLEVSASGPLRLGDSGESNLRYRVTHGRLEEVGPLIGRDLAGRLLLEGTITGNRQRLASTGTADADGLRVDAIFSALEVDAAFEASLPDLRTDGVELTAKVESVLPVISGRTFRSLTADAKYAASELQFDATVREDGRTVAGSGTARFAADAREVRVERLNIDAAGTVWGTPDGRGFTVRYGQNGLLTLSDVELVSGEQRLFSSGAIGLSAGADSALDVRLERANLKSLGTLMLVERELDGMLSATASVTGDPEHRQAKGEVTLLSGTVDGFSFESLTASLNLADSRMTLDALLRQSEGAELRAKGAVPIGTGSAAPKGEIDVDVTSTGINLAVLQAATTAFREVQGRLLVNVHVSGTMAAPQGNGSIKVEGGAFTLAVTGAEYSGAELDVALEGEQVRIQRLHMLDDGGQALDGSGRLGLRGRQVTDIDFTMAATEFKVLDNELGELSINSSVNVSGTVLEPNIVGLVRVQSGRIEVDRLVDRLTSSAYELPEETRPDDEASESSPAPPKTLPVAGVDPDQVTQPAQANQPGPPSPALENQQGPPQQAARDQVPPVPAPSAPAESTTPSIFGPTFDLTVEVPGNLVLRGNDMRAPGAAVSLGAVNLTVGGDFRVEKRKDMDAVLVGTVRTVRGTYDFQGRRFDVQRDGMIDFRGERPIDPALDVAAERTVQGVIARVNIGGTMMQPDLTLSSDPPLDEADILSLIIFNQPVNQLGEGQRVNLGERALGLATSFVVSPLNDTLQNALDVDLFQIDTATDEGGGPAITVGEQVGEKLFVRFRQIFGAQDASEFQLEYQLTDILRLQGSYAEGSQRANRSLARRIERGGIDLILVFSY
jgi:autotransporter translocation and assembly factor TamB